MIRGLISPVLTPFNDDLTIASDLYADLCRNLLKGGGCSGLAPFGTTGEALSVGIEERMAALDMLIEAGIDPACMIPGTGLTNLPDTAALTRHAVERGCAGAMVLPAFYYKGVSDDGLLRYFASLIEMVDNPDLKIYLYHIPQVSGVGLPVPLARRLHEAHPEVVVGIKDSSGEWDNTKGLLEIESFVTYPGSELPVIDAVRLGAPGCISATANINGASIAKVIDLCHAGDWEAAEKAHETVKGIRLKLQDYAPIPAQKALLARATGDSRWANLRPPLEAMPGEKAAALEAELADEFGFSL